MSKEHEDIFVAITNCVAQGSIIKSKFWLVVWIVGEIHRGQGL